MARKGVKKKGGNKVGGLTPRQAAFAREYVLTGNASEAARRAGYNGRVGEMGYALLRNPGVQAAIDKARREADAAYEVSRDRVIGELARIAFSNELDFTTIGEDGEPRPDFSKLDRNKAAAIAEITIETYMDGHGEDAREVKRTRVRRWDKQKALADLSKLLGYNEEKDAGQHSAPIEFRITVVNERGEPVDLIEAPRVIDVEADKPGLPLADDDKHDHNGNGHARIRA